MTSPSSDAMIEPLTDNEAEAAFIALVEALDRLGCCPAATMAGKEDEGVSFSLHFSATRARQLIDSMKAKDEASPADGNWTEEEQVAIRQLCAEQDLSEQQLLRCALRHYHADHERLKAGETVTWSGDAQRAEDFFPGHLARQPQSPSTSLSDASDNAFQIWWAEQGYSGLQGRDRHSFKAGYHAAMSKEQSND